MRWLEINGDIKMSWVARMKAILKYLLRAMGMAGLASSIHNRLIYWLHPPLFRDPEAPPPPAVELGCKLQVPGSLPPLLLHPGECSRIQWQEVYGLRAL